MLVKNTSESKSSVKITSKDENNDIDAGNSSPLEKLESYSKSWQKDINIYLTEKEVLRV